MTGAKYFLFVLLLGGMSVVNPLAIDAFIPAMPTIAKDLAVDPGTVGITLGFYAFGTAIGQIIFGPLADRYGRRPIILLGFSIYIVAAVASAFATSITQLALLRLLHGTAAASGRVIATSIVRDLYEREQAGKILSYMFVVSGTLPIVGPLIGSELVIRFEWQSIFWFMAIVSGIIFLSIWLWLKETLAEPDLDAIRPGRMLYNFGAILSNKTFLGYALCHSLAGSALYSFLATGAEVFITGFGTSTRYFAAGFAIIMTSNVLGAFTGGRLVSKLGIDRIILLGTSVTFSSGVILLVLASAGLATPVLIVLIFSIYKFADSMTNPQSAAAAMTPFSDRAGAASSLLGFMRQAVGALAAILIGALADGTALPMALGIAFAGAAAFLIRITLIRRLNAPDS